MSSSQFNQSSSYGNFPRNGEYDKFFHTKRLLIENQAHLKPDYVQKSIAMIKEADDYIEKGVRRLRGESFVRDLMHEYYRIPQNNCNSDNGN